MWNAIVNFFASIIELFFNWTGNFGVAVILFTILVKCITLPLDLKSKSATDKIQAIQPEIQKIKEKYPNDTEKQNKKMQELYVKNHINPLGGCLPMLLTFPLIIILFAALRQIAAEYMYKYMEDLLVASDGNMKAFLDEISATIASSKDIKMSFENILPMLFNNAGKLPAQLSNLPDIITQEKCDILINAIKDSVSFEQAQLAASTSGYSFLWIKNIWVADSPLKSVIGTSCKFAYQFCNGWFILPVLSTATQYLQQYLTSRNQKKPEKKKSSEPDPTQSMNFMTKFMPLISLYFCAVYNSAFAIYWTVSNFVSIAQTLITNFIKKRKAKKEEVIKL